MSDWSGFTLNRYTLDILSTVARNYIYKTQ